jgi:sugar phosphate isomerase/epimerase
MGMPRALTWDGILPAGASPVGAPAALAGCIASALVRSGLSEPPEVCVEFHPFTLALAHDLLEETSAALAEAGAGVCLDFCHFGVALGPGFEERLSQGVLDAVTHVHWCDSDCETSELHFPPGVGVLDLHKLGRVLAGRDVELSWDLFAWPEPRYALSASMPTYAAAVERHRAALEAKL